MTGTHPLHLWLDLDHTLICAMPGFFPEHLPDAILPPEARHAAPEAPVYALYARPGLHALLAMLGQDPRVRLGLWTAASRSYAEAILHTLGVRACFAEVLGGDACRAGLKDLAVLAEQGLPLGQVVFVDDHPERIADRGARVLPIAPFRADPADRVLEALSAAVEALLVRDTAALAAARAALTEGSAARWYTARGWRWVHDPTGETLRRLG